ncbi:hypothetical protein [Modestobacter marinus]|uniref:hypothetical protein n=1 Tax=Modestobacter marinus TaxID=477641 RepID=UPI00201AF65D|nr:hypothetical protein [Modestobacter marinus]
MNGTAQTLTKATPAEADDVRQLVISAAVSSGLTAITLWRPSAGRRAVGIFFALTGLVWNGILTAKAPEQYPMLARRAPWGWYRRLGLALTEPAPRVFGAAMTAGETALAAAVLSRDPSTRLGLLGVAAFLLGITPLGTYTLGNPILAAGVLHLARRPWPTAAFHRRRRSS